MGDPAPSARIRDDDAPLPQRRRGNPAQGAVAGSTAQTVPGTAVIASGACPDRRAIAITPSAVDELHERAPARFRTRHPHRARRDQQRRSRAADGRRSAQVAVPGDRSASPRRRPATYTRRSRDRRADRARSRPAASLAGAARARQPCIDRDQRAEQVGPPAQTAAHIVSSVTGRSPALRPAGSVRVDPPRRAGAVQCARAAGGTTGTVCPPFSTCRPDWLPHPAASTDQQRDAAARLMPAAPAARS